MGNYATTLTERRAHTKIVTGYCLICGSFGKLSWDHVPPQGSITITSIEQLHLSEVLGVMPVRVKGVTSPNGSKFRTICGNCNSVHLGTNDQEVKKVYKGLTKLVSDHFRYGRNHLNSVAIRLDAVKFCRAMVGHVLAATTVNECKAKPVVTPYFTPLQKFVMGDDTAISSTHDFYCWFYPYRHHLSAKLFAFKNRGHIASISVLSFFPLAFSITEKGRGIYPSGATKVELSDQWLHVNLDSRHFPFSGFPLTGLSGDQLMALSDAQAIVSFPLKK